MKYCKFATLSLLLLLSACASMPKDPIKTVPAVDLPRFMGPWYVIASIPTFLEKGAHNAVESYALDPDGSIATSVSVMRAPATSARASEGPSPSASPSAAVRLQPNCLNRRGASVEAAIVTATYSRYVPGSSHSSCARECPIVQLQRRRDARAPRIGGAADVVGATTHVDRDRIAGDPLERALREEPNERVFVREHRYQ